MKYMGSKRRIAKEILPFILKDRKPEQWYVEPFVGGANMIDKVTGNRIGADVNGYLIEALKLIRDNPESLPDYVSEEEYKILKDEKVLNGLTGVVGFGCSFGGKWFGGYARAVAGEIGGRGYMRETRNNALKQSPNLQGVLFINSGYEYLDIPKDAIIYCDPPYAGTTGYKDKFNHDDFWEWAREKSKAGHPVFISEYMAPPDFMVIWEGELTTNLNGGDSLKATEKLFTFDDIY